MKIIVIVASLVAVMSLQSCAVGSATAAYALQSRSAESLTSEAEYKIIQKAKNEMILELESR